MVCVNGSATGRSLPSESSFACERGCEAHQTISKESMDSKAEQCLNQKVLLRLLSAEKSVVVLQR